MKKSDSTSTSRVTRVDEVLKQDHYYLAAEDECYYFGEYQPAAGYSAGPINHLISNFKKPVSRRGLQEYRYKLQAIREVAKLVKDVIDEAAFETCTVVPIPPSKAKTDPLYDDRLLQALRAVDPRLDVRELLVAKVSQRAHHEYRGEKRPTPDQLYEVLDIDERELAVPVRSTIILFDDLLTNGTHFRACKRHLNERLPDRSVVGLFIGRVKRPDAVDDFAVLFGDQV